MLASIARAYLEHLKAAPEDSNEYKAVYAALDDWEWWDAQQRERGSF